MELLLQKARLVGDQEWNADVGGPRVRDRHPRASHHPLHLARRGADTAGAVTRISQPSRKSRSGRPSREDRRNPVRSCAAP